MAKFNEFARSDNAQRAFDDFQIVCSVGKGTYGQVYKAFDSSARKLIICLYVCIVLYVDSHM